jgi:hypothetical protein
MRLISWTLQSGSKQFSIGFLISQALNTESIRNCHLHHECG